MDDYVNNIAAFFKALGDPTRLKIIKLLATEGSNLCVGALTKKLSITQPAVSQHLKVLKNAGILEAERIGFHVHYNINWDTIDKFKINIDDLTKKISLKNKSDCKNENYSGKI